MEKRDFDLSKKEVLETIGWHVKKTKYPHYSEEEFLVMSFSSTLKERII